jgi:hypothetical protein
MNENRTMEMSLESATKALLLLAVLNATIARATGGAVSVLPAADSASAASALLPPETESQLAAAREACAALGQVVETLMVASFLGCPAVFIQSGRT